MAEAPAWLDPAWLGRAICYSGYRDGQSPSAARYPAPAELREDLRLLARHFGVLRLYDCGPHALRVLEVLREERLPLRVLLGAWLEAEADNPGCPWGGVHGAAKLALNVAENARELERLARLARDFPDQIFAVAVGNEACVGWTDHLVPPERVAGYVRAVRREVRRPVTVCDNHVPWHHGLAPLAEELDFLSVHAYPAWEGRPPAEALASTERDWSAVAARHPGKPVVLTEVGWPTASNGRGVRAETATPEVQAEHVAALEAWSRRTGVLAFVFEAFDEAWKGGADPLDPEKHWGLFTSDRRPKPAVAARYPDLPPAGAPP
jgi:exo-beta-1,3-glucanase (GH17 family)